MDNQSNQSLASFTLQSSQTTDWNWRFWPILPLYPYGKRRTLRQTVVPDTIWTFDQIQGILYTVVPIRMTVVRLAAGGLLVYAPVAPTAECVRLVRELEAAHGAVKYIILPTSSGLEHKIFVGPFARQFPQAQVYVAPNQWSFPFKLPLSWLGFPPQRTQILPSVSWQAPFADEFDYAILDIDLGQGSFAEVPFLHRDSSTLLVTDSLISIPAEPPPLLQLDPYPLLFHARDSALEPIQDTPANRLTGWQRICLFAVYFRPSALEPVSLGRTLQEAWQSPDRSRRAYFGLYPFCWKPDWLESFVLLHASGRPFVAPILQTLIFPQAPRQVLDWADRIATWEFEQVVPCHFDSPIAVTPLQFRQAFSFLERNPQSGSAFGDGLLPLPDADFEFIREIEATLIKRKISLPPKDKV